MTALPLFDPDEERARAAESMTPADRFLAGPDLFDLACSIASAGIRDQYPDASPSDIDRLLAERIRIGVEVENDSARD